MNVIKLTLGGLLLSAMIVTTETWALEFYSHSQMRHYSRTYRDYSELEVQRQGLRKDRRSYASKTLRQLGSDPVKRSRRFREQNPQHSQKKLIRLGNKKRKR